ncbi:MAG TPA: replication-associated recombination protein A [Myxococcota bacterium]|nr:replication-associated recombination protein A [Myxococcota bacterium]
MPPDDAPSLFSSEALVGGHPPAQAAARAPLADRMRPQTLDEVVGQDHLVAAGAALRSLAESKALPSLILWGPPGCGKTTLARLLAQHARASFESLSAVMAGVKEIREIVARARRSERRTLLFLDELHRLNRAQQDSLLPHVEAGTVTLIGATTENPSFEVNAPLLSRCRVFTLSRLGEADLGAVVRRAATDAVRGLGRLGVAVGNEAVAALAHAADGDARRALGLLEAATAVQLQSGPRGSALSLAAIEQAAGQRLLLHDRDREEHYNCASALIKSLRASDPDAALYYAARMLEAGDDPLFVARRLIVFAAEDIGNAEPQALGIATAAFLATERIGMPEARIPLAQAVTFLACAPKSNASYLAIDRAIDAVRTHGSLPVPLHLRNAPTPLMKGLGYGRDYAYPHATPGQLVTARNLPEALGDPAFYEPTGAGDEAPIAQRLADWRARRSAAHRGGGGGSGEP